MFIEKILGNILGQEIATRLVHLKWLLPILFFFFCFLILYATSYLGTLFLIELENDSNSIYLLTMASTVQGRGKGAQPSPQKNYPLP